MASADDEEEYRALCASARPEDCVLWEECLKQTDLEFDYAPADVEKAEFQPMSTHFGLKYVHFETRLKCLT
jgi:hypothetical protein